MSQKVVSEPLVTIPTIVNGPLPDIYEPYKKPLLDIVNWMKDYLCNPHPELGRKGPVCPYVKPAMERNSVYMSVYRDSMLTKDSIRDVIMDYQKQFLKMEPQTGEDAIFKCFLILFPNLPSEEAPALIDSTQEALSPAFVPEGLMLGEFHDRPPKKPGLWNEEFMPLWSPVPMLAIRHMVPTDILFLHKRRDLLEPYLKRFGQQIPPRFIRLAEQACERLDLQSPRLIA